jgi:uncharacterized membrane-anchored protein YhcB (DUF1043 family)
MQNNVATYLFYAIGEIILVVIGILIAVQIDDWNKQREEIKQQTKHYKDIIIDLKKDSIHFHKVLEGFKRRQRSYYSIYREISTSTKEAKEPSYDYLLYNAQFSPTMIKNHQQTIDVLKDNTVRQMINEYSEKLNGVQVAIDEYNLCVYELMRPYTLEKKLWNVENVFHEDMFGFLPKNQVIDQERISKLYGDEKMLHILSYQRISSGFSIHELQGMIEINHTLIKILQTKLNQ